MEYDSRNWTTNAAKWRTKSPLLGAARSFLHTGHSWLQSLAFRMSHHPPTEHPFPSPSTSSPSPASFPASTTTTSTMTREEPACSASQVHHPHHQQQHTTSSWTSITVFPPLFVLVLFASTVFRIADACSSRSTPKPRPPSPTLRPNITFQTYDCPEAYAKWYCLNGATCFSVRIGESILYNCECADGFMGQRCEFKDLDGSYLPNRERVMIETASIAGGVTVAVLLIVILIIAAYTYVRRWKKIKRMPLDISQSELDRKPFNTKTITRCPGHLITKDPESGHGSSFHPSLASLNVKSSTDFSPGRDSGGHSTRGKDGL